MQRPGNCCLDKDEQEYQSQVRGATSSRGLGTGTNGTATQCRPTELSNYYVGSQTERGVWQVPEEVAGLPRFATEAIVGRFALMDTFDTRGDHKNDDDDDDNNNDDAGGKEKS